MYTKRVPRNRACLREKERESSGTIGRSSEFRDRMKREGTAVPTAAIQREIRVTNIFERTCAIFWITVLRARYLLSFHREKLAYGPLNPAAVKIPEKKLVSTKFSTLLGKERKLLRVTRESPVPRKN